MRNNLFSKGLVIGIIVLFVGAVVAPSISSIVNKKEIEYPSNNLSLNVVGTGWQYRKMITIDHNEVAGDLYNFPVLISVVDSDLDTKAQDDGDDILFSDGSGVAGKLYHEIEKYDGSSGELVAWVKVPNLDGDTDTVFYMYYGNPSCGSQQNPSGVWDSNFLHVWHLGNSLSDSAGSDDGNDHGTSLAFGKIGYGRDFKRSEGDYIDCGDMAQPADGSLTTMTWECWIKTKTLDTELMNKYDTSGEDYKSYHLSFSTGGRFGIAAISTSGATKGETEDSYSDVGNWVYLTATYNLGGTNDIDAFVNGDEVAFTQYQNSANVMGNTQVTDDIGRVRYESGTYYADAVMDEVRWSRVVRSDAWINTSFNTMNDPSGFFSVGYEESNQPPNTPTDPNPYDGATNVDVNAGLSWTCSDPNGQDLVFDVFFEANDPTPDKLVSYHQSQTYYNPPGQMDFNTHYYWKIVAWDPWDASTTGPVWDFITSSEPNQPPNPPSNPSPMNGTIDIDLNIDLSWTCSDPEGDNLFYDVYFEAEDPSPDELVSNDQTETSYDPGKLLYQTTYYWQIIAKDEHGASTPGPVWHFITVENEPPGVPLINGQTNGKAGMIYPYTFVSIDPNDDNVFYQIDWGDGYIDDWFGPYESNAIVTKEHSWDDEGTYKIQARAKDIKDAISGWGTLTVTMPRDKAIVNSLFLWLLEQFPILQTLLQRLGLQ